MAIDFLESFRNEFISCCRRGDDYSLFNSDWTLNLKYFIFLLYNNYLTVYILL